MYVDYYFLCAQNEVIKTALAATQRISIMASEEDDDVTEVSNGAAAGSGGYVAVFDPLDGSRNIDASIPTGTIFGLYPLTGGMQQDSVPSCN